MSMLLTLQRLWLRQWVLCPSPLCLCRCQKAPGPFEPVQDCIFSTMRVHEHSRRMLRSPRRMRASWRPFWPGTILGSWPRTWQKLNSTWKTTFSNAMFSGASLTVLGDFHTAVLTQNVWLRLVVWSWGARPSFFDQTMILSFICLMTLYNEPNVDFETPFFLQLAVKPTY